MPVHGFWQNRVVRELPPMPLSRWGENIPRRFLARDRTVPYWVEELDGRELDACTGDRARSRERAYYAWREARAHRERAREDRTWTAQQEENYRHRFSYYEQASTYTVTIDEAAPLHSSWDTITMRPFTYSTTASTAAFTERLDTSTLMRFYNELRNANVIVYDDTFDTVTATRPLQANMPDSIYYDSSRRERQIIAVPSKLIGGTAANEVAYFFTNRAHSLPSKEAAQVLSRYFTSDEKVLTLFSQGGPGNTSRLHPGVHRNMPEAVAFWKQHDVHATVYPSFMPKGKLTSALGVSYDRISFLWDGGVWKLYIARATDKWRPIDPHNPEKAFA